jgi:subtilisin family serine protease
MKTLARFGLILGLLAGGLLGLPQHQPLRAGLLPGAQYEPGQVVVKLAPALAGDPLAIHLAYGTLTLAVLDGHPDILLLQAPPGVDARTLVQLMAGDARLAWAELNHINEYPQDGSTDRIYGWGDDGSQATSQSSAGTLSLGAAHDKSRGAGAVVAVLDTGVQHAHPLLAGSLAPLGYDFVDDDLHPEDEANGLDEDGDGLVDEAWGHGTHVAGIVRLVAPEAAILPLRVLNSDGRGNNFRTAQAVAYATARGADAINLSLGTTEPSLLLREVVLAAARQGTLVVAAAGNLGADIPQYPAADACAIGVTAVNDQDRKASFASYGAWVGVAAPGVSVYSSVPVDGYAWWSGTSMATPFVAGQVALLRGLNPSLTLDEAGALIASTAASLDRNNPLYRGQLGAGRIDLAASLAAAPAGPSPFQGCAR